MAKQELADAGYQAYLDAIIAIAEVHRTGRTLRGTHGNVLVVTGGRLTIANGVFIASGQSDKAEIDSLAAAVAGETFPWSILVRSNTPPPYGVLER